MKELEASADTDPLTGIFNRRGFDRELKRSLAYVKRYWTRAALIYVDLDGFKPVNDRHGHAAGDAMLKAVAATLTGSVRASDTVARLGGDEFGLILWNLSEADAAAKAWALEAAVGEATVEWEGATLSVGASIGFAMLGPSDELADVLAKADHAMYARKAARKGSRLPPQRLDRRSSRDDIRRELILDEGNPVLQEQLALLQPLDLQDVGTGRDLQRLDRGVEVAVLLQQARKLRAELAFFLACHVPQRFQTPPAAAETAPKPH